MGLRDDLYDGNGKKVLDGAPAATPVRTLPEGVDLVDLPVRTLTNVVGHDAAGRVGRAAGGSGGIGTPGPPNVLSIGTVTTLAPTAPATATITGTSPAQTLSLGIPQGIPGVGGGGGSFDPASLPTKTLTYVVGHDAAGVAGKTPGVDLGNLPTATLTYIVGTDSGGDFSKALASSFGGSPNLNLNSVALNDYYNLTGGGSNWSPALAAAFADMDDSGKYLTIHNADLNCSSTVTRSSAKRFIIEGSARSSLNFTGSGNGIELTFSNQAQGPQISDLFIRSAYAGTAGTALRLIGPVLPTHPYWATKLYGVRIAPVDPTAGTWSGGVYLENAWNPLIQDCELKGKNQSTNLMDMSFGIQLQNCQTVHIHKLYATHIVTAVKETGTSLSEGFTCTHSEMVGIATGIELKANLARLNGAIADNHINAYNFCVDASNVWSMSIHDNLMFKVNDFNTNWIGVRLISCKHAKVHDNHFRPSAGQGGATGIVFNNTNFCKAHFNTFDSWGSQSGGCITLFGASSYNELGFNSRMTDIGPAPTMYVNAGSGSQNRYYGNAPDNGVGSFDQFVPPAS